MPRLTPNLLRRAHNLSPHLRTLIPACRDIESAQNELRWIREHVFSSANSSRPSTSQDSIGLYREQELARLCARRGHGEPLQYVLGSQPFGRLELRCRKNVLIPRVETEAYVVHLAGLVKKKQFQGLGNAPRILDLCTGTGCIALLLYEQLHRQLPGTRVWGLDISPVAVSLARDNLRDNVSRGVLPDRALAAEAVSFEKADVFADDVFRRDGLIDGGVDILISNPPYISTHGFNRDTGRSVRNFEPRLALVPDERLEAAAHSLGCELADVFYARLLNLATQLNPKVMLFEVGDIEQARRVVGMAMRLGSSDEFGFEIWRDEPDAAEPESVEFEGRQLVIRGEGHGRSVFVYRRSVKNRTVVADSKQ